MSSAEHIKGEAGLEVVGMNRGRSGSVICDSKGNKMKRGVSRYSVSSHCDSKGILKRI